MNQIRKHVLITGGSSGIGLALAKICVKEGYNVSIFARRQNLIDQALLEMKEELISPQQVLSGFSVDVSNKENISSVITECIERVGDPDVLITSAGIVRCGYFENIASESDEVMQVNYFGTLYAIQSVVPYMLKNKHGNIVIVSSAAGIMGLFGYTSYSPSKFALRGLAECLRAEMKPHNIKVAIAFPPNTQTPQLDYEHEHGIEETRVLSEKAATFSAEHVAQVIMKGIQKNTFAITPGLETSLLYRLNSLINPLLNYFFDKTITKIQRKRK